jgi:hypothetical protein
MAQWKTRKKYKRLRTAKNPKLYQPGELLSCDNVEPVNPKSFEGYTQTFIWRDTATKCMISYSDSEAI